MYRLLSFLQLFHIGNETVFISDLIRVYFIIFFKQTNASVYLQVTVAISSGPVNSYICKFMFLAQISDMIFFLVLFYPPLFGL